VRDPSSETSTERVREPRRVSCRALALGFARVGLSGFGGVLPFAHHVIVVRERWLEDREFTALLAAGQMLPGPNIINLSVMVGRHFKGARGALAAFCGLVLPAALLFVLVGALYHRIAEVEAVRRAALGIGAAAGGLIFGTGLSLARALPRGAWVWPIAVAAFVAVALLRWPLPWVLLGLGGLGVALTLRRSG
jgi:chromate transporter